MKSQDDGARYQKTAHILSFTLLILSLVFSIQQVFTRKTVDPSNISPHDTVLMLAFLYTALCLMVALLINYAKRVGKPRDLSFFVPLVIFAGLCADTLIFYKNNTGFFWLALFILYGIGALYNGFYKLLYFIIVSQVTMLLFF